VSAVLAADELCRDPDARAGFADASFKDERNPELLRYLLNFHRFALVGECGVAGDDQQSGNFRQVGDDVLGNAITEIFLFGIAAHVVEGQDSNCWFFSFGRC
jgi:hypothetical protein